MKTYKTTSTHKDLPNHNIEVQNDLERIVVERWDNDAEMMVEIAIKWQQFAEFEMLKWPSVGTVKAVTFKDGTRKRAKQYKVNFRDNPEAFKASYLCRASCKIRSEHGETFYCLPDLLKFASSGNTAEEAQSILG